MRVECPVVARERDWLEEEFGRLAAEFGRDVLQRDVVLPTPAYFPGRYDGTDDDVLGLLDQVGRWMGADLSSVDLEVLGDDEDEELLAHLPGYERRSDGAAGHYRREGDRAVVGVGRSRLDDPRSLVAVLAHEVAHVRLLGEGRIDAERLDGEPLTDLATVFFGLGILTANAAFDFGHTGRSWRAERLGYLTEPMYGYALALYAHARGETRPAWLRHLDPSPREAAKDGLRYLARGGGSRP